MAHRAALAALASAAILLLSSRPAAAAVGTRALLQNAGPYNENSLVGVPDEVNTGEQYGSGEKVNVCKFPLGSVNAWNLKPYIQYLPVTAQLILATSGRGSFIAPAVGFLHYGPSCYLYDHVCNFNYQEPCNLHGTCQTNNTCFCINGYKTCRSQDGTTTSATAGCETNIYTSKQNCGDCGVVCPTGTSCSLGTCVAPSSVPPPPPTSTSSTTRTTSDTGAAPAAAPSDAAAPDAAAATAINPQDTVVANAAKSKAANAARRAAAAAADAAATAGRRLMELFI